jgi:hypothetical protein
MNTPDRAGDMAVPYAQEYAALRADLARALPLTENLDRILGGLAQQPAEPGETDHTALIADLAAILGLSGGVDHILDNEAGYAGLLADMTISIDTTAGLARIFGASTSAPTSNRPLADPVGTPEPFFDQPLATIDVGTTASAQPTGPVDVAESTNALAKIANAAGAYRLRLRLNRRHRILQAAIDAANDIRRYLEWPAEDPTPTDAFNGIYADLMRGKSRLHDVITLLASAVPSGERGTAIRSTRRAHPPVPPPSRLGDHRPEARIKDLYSRIVWRPPVRSSAVEVPSPQADDPETLRLLRELAATDPNEIVRLAAVQAIATGWADHPDTLPWLRDLATTSPNEVVRLAAAQAVATGRAAERDDNAAHPAEGRKHAEDGAGAEALAVQAAEWGDTTALRHLADLRERAGDGAGAEALAVQAAKWDDAIALRHLTETPGRDEVAVRTDLILVGQLGEADVLLREVADDLDRLSDPALICRLPPEHRVACRGIAGSLVATLLQVSEALANFHGADLRKVNIGAGDLEDIDGVRWCNSAAETAPTLWPASIESLVVAHSESVPWAPGDFVVRLGTPVRPNR